MVDAVVFDLGGNMPPAFAVPDASGLAPLTLPESFLGGRDASQPPPSSEAVLRFASAMGGDGADSAAEMAFRAAWSAPEGSLDEAPVSDPAKPAPEDVAIAAAPVSEDVSPLIGAPVADKASDSPTVSASGDLVADVHASAPDVHVPVQDVRVPTADVHETTPDVDVSAPEVASRVSRPVSAASAFAEESGDVAEEAVQAAPHVVVAASAPQAADVVAPQAVQEVAAVSAATARTETLVETVNQIVEAVVGQLVVTPSLVQGEGEVRMTLKPTVLDGSDITLSAKGGTLTVAVAPATPSAEQAVTAALPRLEIALAEHAPAFRHVEVALAAKRGKIDEVA